jgi:hypothetical protein
VTVAVARFDDDSAQPSQELRDGLAALSGKPVSATALMNFLRWSIRRLPPGARGIKLALERSGDDSGAELIVTLVADKSAAQDLSPQVSMSHEILLDRETLSSGETVMAGIGRGVTLEEVDWGEQRGDLKKGLAARPEQYLLIKLGCEEVR